MAWDFETEPEFQKKLDWVKQFVEENVEPLDFFFHDDPHAHFDTANPVVTKLLAPLKAEVKKQNLWACHLTPELGGQGWGQVKLALMNEVLGQSMFAPRVFGCQAPDTGNAELLAHFANAEQKKKYLAPLLEGDIVSCFAMTEPQGGADPRVFKVRAERQGDHYVLNGEKWFASNARFAAFLLVVTVTDPSVAIHKGASIILVERGTPGMEIIRNVGLWHDKIGEGAHAYVRFTNCRVPVANRIGDEGKGFEAAQVRLGGGRVHHAMRSVGLAKKAFDMLRERAVSRYTQGSQLSEKQMVQEMVADSYAEISQFRFHVLYTAWLIDRHKAYTREVRNEISAIKFSTPRLLRDVVWRAIHIHGSLGLSNETPLIYMWLRVAQMGTVDGPSEVHKIQLAKALLKDYPPAKGLFPSEHFLPHIEKAKERYATFQPELDAYYASRKK